MPNMVPKNILILKYRAMGDAIIGLSAVSYLRSLYPDAQITYGTPKWVAPLFENVTIDADEVLGLELNSFTDWWKLYGQLKQRKIDTVIELFQSGRTAKFFNLWSKLGGGQYFYHNHHLTSGGPVHDQGVIKPVIQRDLDGVWSHLAKAENKPLPEYLDWSPVMKIQSLNKDQIIFGVVATRQTKMWDLENYSQLAKSIKESRPNCEILVPLSQSEADNQIKTKLEQLQAPVTFVQASLDLLPQMLAGSQFYVGNDTGLKHLCVALGIKTFTLFGPEPPLEWHPYDRDAHPYFYIDGLECRTRDAHYCGLATCDSMICLKDISPDNVLEKISTQEAQSD